MKAFVTGATGFLGSHVARVLGEQGADLRLLVRSTSNLRNLEGIKAETATGDLRDSSSLEKGMSGCDTVFHVAADYRLWVRDPAEMYRSNVDGTKAILYAARKHGVRRVVYTSSVATVGFTGNGHPADEDSPVSLADMIGPYKRSKFLAEAEVQKFVAAKGLPVVIVNPSTPVGPRDIKPTPTGRMIVDAASGRMPAYVDTGLNLVHVDDVAIGHLLAMERGKIGERYVLGAENMTLKEILTALAAITGRRPPRIRLPHNLVLPMAYVSEAWARMTGGQEPRVTVVGVQLAKKRMFFSAEKAKRVLGFHPRPIEGALRDAVDWFREHGYLGEFSSQRSAPR
jgi:dihydroflavonol-4-reductase